MGTIQRVSGGITKARGYPGLRATINGVPSIDLQSLLWFEGGTLDAAHPGPYSNSVPGGPGATLFPAYASPTKRSYGLETNADGNGLVINTLVPITRDFTVIACLKSTVSAAVTQWIGWCAPTAHGFPANPANQFTNNLSPWPTLRIHGEGTTPSGNGHIILDNSGTEVPGGSNPILRPEVAPADEATVVAYRCTASVISKGRLELIALPTTLSFPEEYGVQSPNMASVVTTALLNWFQTYEAASTFMLGAWPFGTQRPCTAQVFAFALYNVLLTDDVLFEAMKAIARRVVARGIPITGGGLGPEDIP